MRGIVRLGCWMWLGVFAVGCGDDEESNAGADSDAAVVDGGQAATNDAGAEGDGDGSAGTDGSDDSDGSVAIDEPDGSVEDDDAATLPGDAAACAARGGQFPAPSGGEFMQWWWGGTEDVRSVTAMKASDDYFDEGGLLMGMLHFGTPEVVTVAMGTPSFDPLGDTIPAGTYTCAEVQASVASSARGFALPTIEGAACGVTFTREAVQGGRLEGTFWGFVPPDEAMGKAGGCVTGTFGLTDRDDS